MANENHEVYDSQNICTYTDFITSSNTFTNEQIDACILSAGTPHGFKNRGEIKNGQNAEQVAANSISPWYSRNGMYLEYDTEECNQMDAASWQSYYHILYGYWADGNVALCTDMDIKKYRNQVTITPRTNTYYGHSFDYYELSIVTQYGETGNWNNSVLKPIIIIPTETLRLGSYIGLNSYKHWATSEMYVFPSRMTTTSYNTYISFNDGTGGLAPVTCPCSIGDDFVWSPTSESDSKWFSDDHYNYGWYDINYGGGGGFHAYSFQEYNNIDDLLMIVAICGLKFEYNGTTYKPIVTGGIVTGYTDDMTEESEWDEWENIGDHTIPIDPVPVPPGPEDDDPWDGIDFGGTGAGGGGAFCSVYYMTGAQLTSLKNWSNTSAPEGFDMLPSIIGLQQLPVAVTGAPTTVKFLKSGAITQQGESRVIDTQVPAGTGTGQPISFSLGSVDISRRMQQRGEPYLDYDCTIELFLPFAGTFVLDTQAVMGRTINAEIVIDPVNGTAFAYAWVSQSGQKMPIAYGGGSIAVDLPIASNQWGISRAAFKQASHQMTMNAIKDIGNFIIGLGTYKTGQSGAIVDRSGFARLNIQEGMQAKQIGGQMMTSSAINAATDTASAIVNAHQLNNTNYTAVNGSFGGSYAEWSQPFTAYVRITRPKFKKPSNFNHTQAVPCVETKTLSSCTGLTICVNPDCGSISCTEAEKIMIAQALVGGVYTGGGK